MRAEKTEIDVVADELHDEREDTFRTGPPGGMAPVQEYDDSADTGEMLAAVDADEGLEEADPTEVAPRVRRVVERVRAPEPTRAPEPVKAKARLPLPVEAPRATPKVETPKAYDPFRTDDPPRVGVDPAVFPIHRTAPRQHQGQRITLALTAVVMTVIVVAFMVSGDEKPEARSAKSARQERVAARVKPPVPTGSFRDPAAVVVPTGAPVKVERIGAVRRAKKTVVRARPAPLVEPAEQTPYAFSDGRVSQPRSYGDHAEHLAPAQTQPLLIVISEPAALVFKGSKLFGATPLMVPVERDGRPVTVTLRTFGYQDKTIDVRPGDSGNLEASVVLDKDPAFEGMKVVRGEKPRT